MSSTAMAQLNVQLHYDLGHDLWGSQLSNRPRLTATVENFTPDRWGSTYFFIDADFGDKFVKSGYGEIARELRFWKAPIAIHVEAACSEPPMAMTMPTSSGRHGTGRALISARRCLYS